ASHFHANDQVRRLAVGSLRAGRQDGRFRGRDKGIRHIQSSEQGELHAVSSSAALYRHAVSQHWYWRKGSGPREDPGRRSEGEGHNRSKGGGDDGCVQDPHASWRCGCCPVLSGWTEENSQG